MYTEWISQATRVVASLFMEPSEMESVTRDKYASVMKYEAAVMMKLNRP